MKPVQILNENAYQDLHITAAKDQSQDLSSVTREGSHEVVRFHLLFAVHAFYISSL